MNILLVPLEIVFGLLARRQGLGSSWFWRRIGLVTAVALIGVSWWFGWNILFLNTVTEDGWLVGLYNFETEVRLPLEEAADDVIGLAEIEVMAK